MRLRNMRATSHVIISHITIMAASPVRLVVAIIQLIIGILLFLVGVVTAVLGIWVVSIGQGIWGGIWMGVTGIIGIASLISNNGRCLAGTYQAFSIVSAVIASISIILLSIGITVSDDCDNYDDDDDASGWVQDRACEDSINALLGLYIPLLILMIIQLFTSIVAAVYACYSGTCCCCVQKQPGVVTTRTQQYQIFTDSQQGQTTDYPVVHHPASYPPARYPTTNYEPQCAPSHVGVMATPGQTHSSQVI